MDCRDVDNYAELSLDGELGAAERAMLEEHLRNCPRCRRRVEALGWFQSQVRAQLQSRDDEVAPPLGLRTKVTTTLRDAEHRSTSPLRRLLPVTLGLAVLGLLLGSSQGGSLTLDPDVSVERHAAHLPPEVRALGDNSDVAAFLDENFPHAVVLPNVDRDLPASRLVGARLDHLADQKAAFLMYDHRGARVSMLVYPSKSSLTPPPRFEARRVGDRDVVAGRHRGYNLVAWSHGPLIYALVSDVDEHELLRFVHAF